MVWPINERGLMPGIQAYTAHQIFPARIGAQRVELRIQARPDELRALSLVGPVEPLERFVVVAECAVGERNLVGDDMHWLGTVLESLEQLLGLFLLPGSDECAAQKSVAIAWQLHFGQHG